MSKPIFRQLRSEDAAALLAFFRELVAEDPERVERPEDVANLSVADEAKWIENRSQQATPAQLYALCCEVDGRIVAEGEFERGRRWIEHHVAEVRFGVLPAFREHATALVDQLVAAAQAQGVEVLVYFHLATQTHGLSLMERAGFRVVGSLKNYYKRGTEYVDRIYLTRQLLTATAQARKAAAPIGTATFKAGAIEESKLTDFLSKQYGVPAINLKDFDIDPQIIKLVPREAALKHLVIPVNRQDPTTLVVAMVDPSNIYAQDNLRSLTGCTIEPVVATEPSIREAIERYYR